MASLTAFHKATAVLLEETTASTVDKLAAFLSEKIEFDDDMKALFEEFKKTAKEEIRASFKTAAATAGKKGRGGKDAAGGEKKKREPSAYNLFIKDKMAEIKAKRPELKGKDLMKEAIVEWKKIHKKE